MIEGVVRYGLKKNFRGFGRIVKQLFPKGKIATKNCYGAWLYLDPYQKIDSSVLRLGYFDKEVYEALIHRLKDGDVFWDVGANIGLHTITIKKNNPCIECLAFEPFPESFQSLIANVRLNKLKIRCFNFALHSEVSLNRLYSSYTNSGLTGFFEAEGLHDTKVEVPAFTGDFIIDKFSVEHPNVIKIDTEGNELSILKGLKAVLENKQLHTVVLECNQDYDAIEALLKDYGFSIQKLGESPNYQASRIG